MLPKAELDLLMATYIAQKAEGRSDNGSCCTNEPSRTSLPLPLSRWFGSASSLRDPGAERAFTAGNTIAQPVTCELSDTSAGAGAPQHCGRFEACSTRGRPGDVNRALTVPPSDPHRAV